METLSFLTNVNIFSLNQNKKEVNYPVYEFQILRYEANVVTEEFVNVGMVMFEPESDFLAFKTIENLDRIVHFFNNEVSKDFLKKCFETIENNFLEFQMSTQNDTIFASDLIFFFDNKNTTTEQNLTNITEQNLTNITNQILPKNDGALYFSDVKTALKIQKNKTMKEIFEDTFEKIVNHYTK